MKTNDILNRFFNINRLAIFRCLCKRCGIPIVYEDEEIICCECKEKVFFIDAPVCRHCGIIIENRHRICGECIVKPPIYRKHYSYSIYDGSLKDLILLFKYGEIKKLKKLIGEYFIEIFKRNICEEFDFLIPVPADKKRKREFDPVFEIAKNISRSINTRLLADNLVKRKPTEPQAGLSRSKRLKNLDGVFALKYPTILKGKKILLIDDVYTTGTTIKQCTKCLVEAGADVVAMTLARSM